MAVCANSPLQVGQGCCLFHLPFNIDALALLTSVCEAGPFPERKMAVKLQRNITTPNVLDYLPLTDSFSIMEIIPPKECVGKHLIDLDLRKKHHIQIIGIKDTVEDVMSMVISPSRPIKATDRLIIVAQNRNTWEK